MNMPVGVTHRFDDRNIAWRTIEGIDHLSYYVCHIDEKNRTVDLMFKFAANQKIALHRHKADYSTLVVQGELRIYRQNGELKEVRPVGSYVVTKANDEPHTEGGGDCDVIAHFSNRNIKDFVYEILDENLNTIATFGISEFKALQDLQKTS